MTFLPADFDTAESLWEQAPLSAQEQEAMEWEPSLEDREWVAAQILDAMLAERA